MGRYLSNILRARKTLDELGNCNEWDYFVTLTVDPGKYDRFDLKSFYKAFSSFKRHLGFRFSYVFVPEQHKDGAWHLHGLISGLPIEQLSEYRLSDYWPYTEVKLPNYIRERVAKGEKSITGRRIPIGSVIHCLNLYGIRVRQAATSKVHR